VQPEVLAEGSGGGWCFVQLGIRKYLFIFRKLITNFSENILFVSYTYIQEVDPNLKPRKQEGTSASGKSGNKKRLPLLETVF